MHALHILLYIVRLTLLYETLILCNPIVHVILLSSLIGFNHRLIATHAYFFFLRVQISLQEFLLQLIHAVVKLRLSRYIFPLQL